MGVRCALQPNDIGILSEHMCSKQENNKNIDIGPIKGHQQHEKKSCSFDNLRSTAKWPEQYFSLVPNCTRKTPIHFTVCPFFHAYFPPFVSDTNFVSQLANHRSNTIHIVCHLWNTIHSGSIKRAIPHLNKSNDFLLVSL